VGLGRRPARLGRVEGARPHNGRAHHTKLRGPSCPSPIAARPRLSLERACDHAPPLVQWHLAHRPRPPEGLGEGLGRLGRPPEPCQPGGFGPPEDTAEAGERPPAQEPLEGPPDRFLRGPQVAKDGRARCRKGRRIGGTAQAPALGVRYVARALTLPCGIRLAGVHAGWGHDWPPSLGGRMGQSSASCDGAIAR